MKTQRKDGMLGFHPYFDIWHDFDSRVVSSTCQPHFTLQEVPLYSFLLEDDGIPGLEKIRHKE
jgi:hypothetical protein